MLHQLQQQTDESSYVNACGNLTFNRQSEDESSAVRLVCGTESARGRKRFHEVAHHVDLRLLETLRLAPDDRVVEQTECLRPKLTLELCCLAGLHDQHLTPSQHLQLQACTRSTYIVRYELQIRNTISTKILTGKLPALFSTQNKKNILTKKMTKIKK